MSNNIKQIIKKAIEQSISEHNYEYSQELISEYESIFGKDEIDIISMQSVIYLLTEQTQVCKNYLLQFVENNNNSDLLYNLATAYEIEKDYINAVLYFRKAQLTSLDASFRWELTEKIASLIYHDKEQALIDSYLSHLRETKKYTLECLRNISENINPSKYVSTLNPFRNLGRSIFIGTMEIANHIAQYTSTFRKFGRHVFSINHYPSYLKYENDLTINITSSNSEHTNDLLFLNAVDIITEFDYFHLVFNTTLMPDGRDLVPFKHLQKKVFMHNLGSEIRIPSVARSHHKYWKIAEDDYLKRLNEDAIKNNMSILSNYIDNVIVNDFEMYSYVKPYYKNIYMIGLPITLDKYKFSPSNNSKLKIVHAPTNPAVKGSEYFLKAINDLRRDYDFEFIKVQGYSHEEAKKIYEKADIILDELVIGTYGSLTIESLAMGKCVVTYLSDSFKTPHGDDVPVQIANADNVKDKIKELLDSKELRESLSLQGRRYVEKHCDVNKICESLIEIYEGKGTYKI